MDGYPMTVEQFMNMIGLIWQNKLHIETGEDQYWCQEDGDKELNFDLLSANVVKQDNGITELVISIPFKVEGL